MIMSSVNDKRIHHDNDIEFSSSREFLDKSIRITTPVNQLESYWLNALSFREQKDTEKLRHRLESIIDGRSQKVESTYRLYAARELAILQYEMNAPISDIKQSLAIIENNLEKILITSADYSFFDYESVEKVITMWAYLDVNLKIGNILSAEYFIFLLESRVRINELLPKLHKVMVSDFYRSLYMYYLIKGNKLKSDQYYKSHSSLCEQYGIPNSMIWINNIKRSFDR